MNSKLAPCVHYFIVFVRVAREVFVVNVVNAVNENTAFRGSNGRFCLNFLAVNAPHGR
jgi:hypothetical protein